MKKIYLLIFFMFSFFLFSREFDRLKFLYDLNNYISIPLIKTSPVIDGKIEKNEWSKMASFTGFYDYEKGEEIFAEKSPIFFAGYNEESIFFLFLIKNPENRELIVNTLERDGPVYKDDSIEIFLVPDGKTIYQFVINSNGIILDLKDKNYNWDGDIKVKPFKLNKKDEILNDLNIAHLDYWGLEVKIPFKNFNIKNPFNNEWKVNFAVNSPNPKFVFSSCVKSFYEIEKYNIMKFIEEGSPYLQITQYNFEYGNLFLKGKLFNPSNKKINFKFDIDLRKKGSYISEGAWQEMVGIIEPHSFNYTLNPYEEIPILFEKDISAKKEINSVAVALFEDKNLYFLRKGFFEIKPILNINFKNFPSNKYIILEIDGEGLIEKYNKEEVDWVEFENLKEAKKFGWKALPEGNPNLYIPQNTAKGKFALGIKGWQGKYNCGLKLERDFSNYKYQKGDKLIFYLRGECHSSYGPGKGAIIIIAKFKDNKSIWRALYPFLDKPMDWKKFEIDMDLTNISEDPWKTWKKYNPDDEINNNDWSNLKCFEIISYFCYWDKDFIEIDGFRIEKIGILPGNLNVEIKDKNEKVVFSKIYEELKNKDEIKIDYSNLKDGEYKIFASFLSDKEEKKFVREFKKIAFPDWWDSIYDKYVKSKKVLKPWIPIEYGEKEVKVWGRSYIWEDSILPSKIITQGVNILSSSIKLKIKFENKEFYVPLNKFKFIEKDQNKGKMIAEGKIEDINFLCNMWIEYDGFLWIDLEIENLKNKKIEELKVEVPLNPQYMKLYQSFDDEKLGWIKGDINFKWMVDPNNTIVNFYHWFGNEDLGIGFIYPSMENWYPKSFNNFCSFKKNLCVYELNLIEKNMNFKNLKYSFGIQATPVKPIYPDWHSMVGSSLLYNDWLYIYSSPENIDIVVCWGDPVNKRLMIGLNNITNFGKEELKNIIEYSHKKGFPITAPAVCPQKILPLMPPFEDYFYEWKKEPESILNWAGIVHYQDCVKSESFRRWYFNAWVKNIKEFKFDGIYFDGWLGGTMACNNLHHGCGWTDENGKIHVSVPILEGREFHKALALFMEENLISKFIPPKTIEKRDNFPNYHIWIHSWLFVPPIMGFGTLFVTGEFIGYPKKGPSTFTPEGTIGKQMDIGEFRARGLSTHWGIPNLYHPCIWEAEKEPKTDRQTRMILAWFMPHGVPIAFINYMNHHTIKKIYGIRQNFGDRKSNFIPCWKENPFFEIITPKKEEIILATWDKLPEKRILAVISNLSVDKEEEIILKWKGFENPLILNAENGEKIKIKDNIINLKIFPEDFVFLEIKGE